MSLWADVLASLDFVSSQQSPLFLALLSVACLSTVFSLHRTFTSSTL